MKRQPWHGVIPHGRQALAVTYRAWRPDMCGIAGILDLGGGPPEPAQLAALGLALEHRGPDGAGTFLQGPIGLVHRRLAIIDPAGGAQPMASPDGTWVVSFNGEIYNHVELRRELEAAGRTFTSRSDTEVVLAAFERWGVDAPTHLRGMFAIAAACPSAGRVLLVRDHLGIKPLLWTHCAGRIAFASELGALRALPWFDDALDLAAIDQFLRLQYIPAPATVYRAVRKLQPGCLLDIDVGSGQVAERRYWRPTWGQHAERSIEDWVERIAAAVDESVAAHLIADVPYGVFLSGGMDSSLVAAAMARCLGRPPTAFCIGFEDERLDETSWARQAAAMIGADLRVEMVRMDALAILPQLLEHYGEPFGDSSAIPTWHVSRLARREVKMVLSGDGGDEFFAGYHSYSYWSRLHAGVGRSLPKRLLRPILSRLLPACWPPAPPRTTTAWFDQSAYLPRAMRDGLWRPELRPVETEPGIAADLIGLDALAMAQAIDVESYLPNDILTKVDIASMAHGLEVRTPLTDVRVLEAAAAIPPALRQEMEGGRVRGKAILRRVAEGRLRPGFFDRPKQGFAAPVARWLAPGGNAQVDLVERIADRNGPLAELLLPEAARAVCRSGEHEQVWLLLVLDTWLRARA